MDFKQWIYSPDIARWLSEEGDLGLVELTDCILSAPHRTLGEKLEGLRKLRQEAKGERRQGRRGWQITLSDHRGRCVVGSGASG